MTRSVEEGDIPGHPLEPKKITVPLFCDDTPPSRYPVTTKTAERLEEKSGGLLVVLGVFSNKRFEHSDNVLLLAA